MIGTGNGFAAPKNPCYFREIMELSEAEVRHVAALARLDLSDKEVESLAKDMNQILGYVAKLNELDTDDVEPTTHVVEMSTPYRDDVVSRRHQK